MIKTTILAFALTVISPATASTMKASGSEIRMIGKVSTKLLNKKLEKVNLAGVSAGILSPGKSLIAISISHYDTSPLGEFDEYCLMVFARRKCEKMKIPSFYVLDERTNSPAIQKLNQKNGIPSELGKVNYLKSDNKILASADGLVDFMLELPKKMIERADPGSFNFLQANPNGKGFLVTPGYSTSKSLNFKAKESQVQITSDSKLDVLQTELGEIDVAAWSYYPKIEVSIEPNKTLDEDCE